MAQMARHPKAAGTAEVIAHATVALDGKANAMQWLQQPNTQLGNKTPLQVAFTGDAGELERVDEFLSALENGIHA